MSDYSKRVYIYVDEYGAHDLNTSKKGNEDYFIYSAVIIEEQHIDDALKSTQKS